MRLNLTVNGDTMSDYIVFTVGTNAYAIDVAYVERIVQIPNITPVVNAHPFIDGMIVYHNKTTKILSFRKASGMTSQEDELVAIFKQVKEDHRIWVESLKKAVAEGSEFTLTTDPHACRLGKWLDSYTTNDPEVIALLRALMPIHARLHELGKEILALRHEDPKRAAEMLSVLVDTVFAQTVGQIDTMIRRSDEFARYQQKLVIYHTAGESIALKVDAIDDIAVIDDAMIKPYDHSQMIGSCLKTRGIVEHKGKLVIVVDTVSLPREER